jgi:hypothetical protein
MMDAPMPVRLPLLFLLLLLSCLLLAVGAAQADAFAGPASASALEVEFEGEFDEAEEEVEEEVGECEIAEEEVEEAELAQAEADAICAEEAAESRRKAGPGAVAPEECILRSAHAHAALDGRGERLKLTLGYTTYEPIGAKIEIGGGAGHIATIHRHLGRSGVLRIVESLPGNQQPKRITVRLAIPASPRYCGKYQTEKVRVR